MHPDLDEHTTIHFWVPNHRCLDKPNLVLIHGYGGDAKWQFMYQVRSLVTGICWVSNGGDVSEMVEKVVILSKWSGCSQDQKEEQLKKIGRDPVELLIPSKPEDLHVLVNLSIYKYNPFKWAPDYFLQEFIDETLLIWGDKDRVFPLMFGHQLQRHLGPRAKLEIIKNTGHAANIESPDSQCFD
ncbi:hypothetical protein HAX54_043993 [Datura stramonium]|uniref:AB hydrolase-1 domain-containing protein n=1 Tax=Datura stramonium TaxID=4076 RepID=A0ABS8SP07_DATST|nr:hypothetical protein [Datura stramonium]